jgi:predicted unusual protein kinase regulating ubiquinone biosynthesis (AarF/ABC1/UbiB family)
MRKRWVVGAAVAAGALLLRRERSHLTSRTGRTVEMARLGGRLGRRQAMHRARRAFASAERKESLDREHELRTAEDVAASLGNMKGALMKIGQLASFLDDGLPEPIREALGSLQHDAPPMSGDLAAQVIEGDLGLSPDKLFEEWDPSPIAAASIGQVHRAITRDGRAVAVKVQYPGVDTAIKTDLANTALLAQGLGMMFPGFEPGPMIDELKARIFEELDYRLEAKNQTLFADYYAGHPFIHVPAVLADLSGERVLTTELAEGVRFGTVAKEWSQEERDLAGEAVYRFVFRSLYRINAFNGDPHPGNYLFRPGGQVTFLDFGLVKHFTAAEIETFRRMLYVTTLEPDITRVRPVLEEAGLLMPNAPLSDESIAEHFGYFYKLLEDKETAVSHDYAAECVARVIDVNRTYFEFTKYANVPPQFVIIQRINIGLYSLLAELRSRRNWLRVARELWPWTDDPPSTDLGEQELAWLRSRKT